MLTYGYWSIESLPIPYRYNTRVEAKCICGKIKNVIAGHLVDKRSSSCGCMRGSLVTKSKTGHGMSDTSEYHTWQALRMRCENRNNSNYEYYGGRGITYDPRWESFDEFYLDMGAKPGPDYSIDRKDNAGHYCKENCRWASKQEQADNRRTTQWHSYLGKLMLLSQIAELHKLNPQTLKQRMIRHDCTAEHAVTLSSVTGPKPEKGN